MATVKTDTPPQATGSRPADPAGFGAYGNAATAALDVTSALAKTSAPKPPASMDFTDSDKRWLRDLGITTTDPGNFHKVWRTDEDKYKSDHRTWANTYGGRIGMRTVSRGIVGAAFYAAGNMYAGRQMKDYKLEDHVPENVLQHIARFIDNTAGKAIKGTVKAVTRDEDKAVKSVMFRDTVDYGNKVMGRSLGHEAMNVTFDFASMSFGDYMTRYALGLVDPNAKKHWMKDGHVDVPGGLKDLLSNVFRGVTYAAGEDMAVAIPYVFGMRMQRNMINKASPGFKYDSDLALNGGSYKVKNDKVFGDFQLEGMADLMGRFSWYNVGTKMFRDAYSAAQTKVENVQDRWKKGDHSILTADIDSNSFSTQKIGQAAAHAVRYVARTTIKVMAYMLPATAFFFISRSPQSKVRGVAIDAEKGVLSREKIGKGSVASGLIPADKYVSAMEDSGYAGFGTAKPVTPGSNFAGNLKVETLFYQNEKGRIAAKANPFESPTGSRLEAFKDSFYTEKPWYSGVVNFFGKASYDYGTKVDKLLSGAVNKASGVMRLGNKLDDVAGPKRIEKLSRLYANAALSYTPYFMMKTDVLSAEWDTKRTDMALDRTLDGVGHLKWGEFRAGMGEVLRAMMREPFTDPKREEMAQKLRWGSDPEHLSNEAYQFSGEHNNGDRGHGAGKAAFAHESLKPRKITPATFAQLKPQGASWATQEALRQFQDTGTQGQSVH